MSWTVFNPHPETYKSDTPPSCLYPPWSAAGVVHHGSTHSSRRRRGHPAPLSHRTGSTAVSASPLRDTVSRDTRKRPVASCQRRGTTRTDARTSWHTRAHGTSSLDAHSPADQLVINLIFTPDRPHLSPLPLNPHNTRKPDTIIDYPDGWLCTLRVQRIPSANVMQRHSSVQFIQEVWTKHKCNSVSVDLRKHRNLL